jgi:hypothetical protein
MVNYANGIVWNIRHPWDNRKLNKILVKGKGIFENTFDPKLGGGFGDTTYVYRNIETGEVLTKDDIPNMVFPKPNLTKRRIELMGQCQGLQEVLREIDKNSAVWS